MATLYRASFELHTAGRTLTGIAVPWDRPARVADPGSPSYLEEFLAGSTDESLKRADALPLFVRHKHDSDPVGSVTFHRSAEGLLYEAPLSLTNRADEMLTLVNDGVMDSVSLGFRPIRNLQRMAPEGRVTQRAVVQVKELSLVPHGFSAYQDARVLAVRELDDEVAAVLDATEALKLRHDALIARYGKAA